MISRIRHGSSPAFQNVCHWFARLEDEVAGPGLDHVVAEQRAHAALEHEAVLVLARVPVERRRERARETSDARRARSARRLARRS
jgi:hypothetical protein